MSETSEQSSPVGAFLAAQYENELQAFQAALAAVPDERFTLVTVGHTPAWQALHVTDWLRLVVLDDRTPNYHYLGWEDVSRVQALGEQPATVTEQSGKAAVLEQLRAVGEGVVARLQGSSDADLGGVVFSAMAPNGERPRMPALGLHLRHIGYHRGQLALGQKAG